MPEQVTITLNDDGTILVENYEAIVPWTEKSGNFLEVRVTPVGRDCLGGCEWPEWMQQHKVVKMPYIHAPVDKPAIVKASE